MYAVLVQNLPDLRGHGHEVVVAGGGDVNGGDYLGFGKLPDMELVHGENAVDV